MLILKRTRSPKLVPSIRRFPVTVAVLLSTASADTLVGNSQLVDAARDGNVDMVKQLHGTGVDAKPRNNALLDHGVNVRGKEGKLALKLAQAKGNQDAVSLIKKAQARK